MRARAESRRRGRQPSCNSAAAWMISAISASRFWRVSAGAPAAIEARWTRVGRKRLPASSKKWEAAAARTGWFDPITSLIDESSERSSCCTRAYGSGSDAGGSLPMAIVTLGTLHVSFWTKSAADMTPRCRAAPTNSALDRRAAVGTTRCMSQRKAAKLFSIRFSPPTLLYLQSIHSLGRIVLCALCLRGTLMNETLPLACLTRATACVPPRALNPI